MGQRKTWGLGAKPQSDSSRGTASMAVARLKIRWQCETMPRKQRIFTRENILLYSMSDPNRKFSAVLLYRTPFFQKPKHDAKSGGRRQGWQAAAEGRGLPPLPPALGREGFRGEWGVGTPPDCGRPPSMGGRPQNECTTRTRRKKWGQVAGVAGCG